MRSQSASLSQNTPFSVGGIVPVGLCHQPPRKNLFETCGDVRGIVRHFKISSIEVKAFKPLGTESILREHVRVGGE